MELSFKHLYKRKTLPRTKHQVNQELPQNEGRSGRPLHTHLFLNRNKSVPAALHTLSHSGPFYLSYMAISVWNMTTCGGFVDWTITFTQTLYFHCKILQSNLWNPTFSCCGFAPSGSHIIAFWYRPPELSWISRQCKDMKQNMNSTSDNPLKIGHVWQSIWNKYVNVWRSSKTKSWCLTIADTVKQLSENHQLKLIKSMFDNFFKTNLTMKINNTNSSNILTLRSVN